MRRRETRRNEKRAKGKTIRTRTRRRARRSASRARTATTTAKAKCDAGESSRQVILASDAGAGGLRTKSAVRRARASWEVVPSGQEVLFGELSEAAKIRKRFRIFGPRG